MSTKYLSNSELREVQLQIMDSIDEYCVQNAIRYSLADGSLLGAIRHKGFIPWDDDVDVIMPRPDYERFIAGYNGFNPNYLAENYRRNHDFPVTFTKVMDTRTTLMQKNNKITCFGVFVDVFAVDGQPDDYQEFEKYCKEYEKAREDFHKKAPLYKYTTSPIVKLKTHLRAPFYPSMEESAAKIDALLAKYPFGSTSYAGAIIGGSGLHTHIPVGVYDEYARRPFENRSYFCVKDYDTYLKVMYGDYMTPPPASKQRPDHFFKVWWNDDRK